MLIATDMFGGTPSNLGITFLEQDKIEVVTGVNLPMLIKAASLKDARVAHRGRANAARARPQRDLGRFGSARWRVDAPAAPAAPAAPREEGMMTRECVIRNRLGLHARAAAKFVHTATRYTSHIRVSRDGKTMDGKSIMGILLLAAAAGSSVMISADGVDESDAIEALCRLVEGGFGEELWNA